MIIALMNKLIALNRIIIKRFNYSKSKIVFHSKLSFIFYVFKVIVGFYLIVCFWAAVKKTRSWYILSSWVEIDLYRNGVNLVLKNNENKCFLINRVNCIQYSFYVRGRSALMLFIYSHLYMERQYYRIIPCTENISCKWYTCVRGHKCVHTCREFLHIFNSVKLFTFEYVL